MERYDEDEPGADDTLHPCWLDEPRGFVDMASKSANDLESFLKSQMSFAVESWAISQRRWVFSFQSLYVELIHDTDQPLNVNATSAYMPRKFLDTLRSELRIILNRSLSDLGWSTIGFGVMLLQMMEEAEGSLQCWGSYQPLAKKTKAPRKRIDWNDDWDKDEPRVRHLQTTQGNTGWNAATTANWSQILANNTGLNLLTVEDTAKHLLGISISEICKELPDFLRILHVEPVFRDDLVLRFLSRQQEMKKELAQLSYAQLRKCISGRDAHARRISNTREALAEVLSEPCVTFHGAPRRVVSSIVRYGFIMPGQKIGQGGEILDIRCGASYGTGIYSSPDPWFASVYTDQGSSNRNGAVQPSDIPGMRLVVCATLMGRAIRVSREETRRTEGLFVQEAHAHVSPNELEYVVFDSAQILPCYVLHIDYGAEEAKEEFYKVPRNPSDFRDGHDARKSTGYHNEDTSPGALLAKKQARKAAASKWASTEGYNPYFPYGYGPATGTRFVIEEIAEISDDEEDYGEFQAVRNQRQHEVQETSQSTGGSWFDEYQTVRRSEKEVRPASDREEDW